VASLENNQEIYLTDHRYLIQTLHNNSVNRCLEMSNKWQLQRNLAKDRRIKMKQTSTDVQNSLVHHHPIHTKNDINPLAFQDDKTCQEHSPDKLEWDFMDDLISSHLDPGSVNGIWY
jgi:hypothetical protein